MGEKTKSGKFDILQSRSSKTEDGETHTYVTLKAITDTNFSITVAELAYDLEDFFSEYTDYSKRKLAPIVHFTVMMPNDKNYTLVLEWEPESVEYLTSIARQIFI